MSDHARLGLGVLAVAWFAPVFWWGVLALRSQVRTNRASVVFLVHRGLPGLILLGAAVADSWTWTWVAVATGVVTSVCVTIMKRRWPEQWAAMGPVES